MISNQIIQHTIDGVHEISDVELMVLDAQANILARTDEDHEDYRELINTFIGSEAESQVIQNNHYFKVFDDGELSFIVVAKGRSKESYTIGRIVVFQMNNLLVAYRDRYDREDFIKNLLLDNLLLVDILNRSQKLHIEMRAKRVVMLAEIGGEKDANIMEMVRGLFTTGRDFITAVDENDIIIVREMNEDEDYAELEKTARVLVDMLGSEAMTRARVSYGTIIKDIKEVSRSYKEAKMALDVGKIFYSDRNVIAYSNLGIGRLIYQLPLPLCKMFISEIFGAEEPLHFDEETLTTIDQFFANNLNVSKTSRELYIHRNTLVYRLEKLYKMTGLDIQTFDDAITFQIALMVMKYMKYLESIEY
ncbi:MAG: helix-turn-helix domain-containing protein [Eubacterium sp.]|nr:helix-turn-helix domain-containing protein [Eubacterium sp.]